MTGPVGIRQQGATNQVSGVLGETGADRVSVPHTETRYRFVANPEEITHLVCCRDFSWRVAFCGFEGIEVNPAAEIICAMCLEEVSRLRPDLASGQEIICPVDGNRCPDEDEIDRRIAGATDSTS